MHHVAQPAYVGTYYSVRAQRNNDRDLVQLQQLEFSRIGQNRLVAVDHELTTRESFQIIYFFL
jgi:hypothetical protein